MANLSSVLDDLKMRGIVILFWHNLLHNDVSLLGGCLISHKSQPPCNTVYVCIDRVSRLIHGE